MFSFRWFVTILLCSCTSVYAQVGEVDFTSDPAEYYGARFFTVILLFGAILLLYSLVRYRGRLDGPWAWAFLLAGVLLFPSVSTMLGTLLVFERAERVEFCGSCHEAMQEYVNDMENPESPSLAAVHFRNRYIPRNQCYTCHTSFGLFGTVQAKISGVVDVHKYYMGSFGDPIQMREPYGNADCLKCHSGAVKWSENHAPFRDTILAGEMVCLGCHGTDHAAHILPE